MAPLDVHRRAGQVRQWLRDVYGFVPMIRDVSYRLVSSRCARAVSYYCYNNTTNSGTSFSLGRIMG